MSYTKFVIASVALALLSTPVLAASEDGQFNIRGAGSKICAEFLKAVRSGQGIAEFSSWTNGYITAYNYFQPDTVDIVPWQSDALLSALLAQYCERKPAVLYIEAVTQMVNALYGGRVSDSVESVTVESGEESVELYAAILRRAIQALDERGFYHGPADAQFGPEISAAFTAFQEREEIPVTGLPDHQTLYYLFVE